ncbi:MAG: hypothetical protein M9904_02390 [Chitinophagaceae bacterium]|nr:hypothetical protein [Chitinophagaceae bacterium]
MMELDEKVEDVSRKLDNVLQLLRGNDLDKQDTGLVGVVNDIDARVIRLEKWKDRLIAGIIGMSVPASIGLKEIFIGLKNFIQ